MSTNSIWCNVGELAVIIFIVYDKKLILNS